jgi:hypothetical protein
MQSGQGTKISPEIFEEMKEERDFNFQLEEDFFLKLRVFGNRPDVIFKTVLRCFKKYYNQDFNRLTNYKKLKRRVSMKNRELKIYAEEYI